MEGAEQGEFTLGKPALVCRWRLANRQVPLLNRHVRALAQRTVNGAPLTANLLSWVKQHIEWSLAEDGSTDPDGVLMLVVDEDGRAAMSVGAYAPLASTAPAALVERAAGARAEEGETGVAPELLAYADEKDGSLTLVADPAAPLCGAASLAVQLAQTHGWTVGYAATWDAAAPELMLISDEHGVVPAAGHEGPVGAFLARGYDTLRDKAASNGGAHGARLHR